MKKHADQILPSTEGGPAKKYNKQRVPARQNLKKRARLPNPKKVAQSSNQIRLADEINMRSQVSRFKLFGKEK